MWLWTALAHAAGGPTEILLEGDLLGGEPAAGLRISEAFDATSRPPFFMGTAEIRADWLGGFPLAAYERSLAVGLGGRFSAMLLGFGRDDGPDRPGRAAFRGTLDLGVYARAESSLLDLDPVATSPGQLLLGGGLALDLRYDWLAVGVHGGWLHGVDLDADDDAGVPEVGIHVGVRF
jgi:hypothetical protein